MRSNPKVPTPQPVRRFVRPYGGGEHARKARAIAMFVLRELGREVRLDGPHARKLIREAAAKCPLVENPTQAQAVVDGWEGLFNPYTYGSGMAVGICRSAGRQLAIMKGVFS